MPETAAWIAAVRRSHERMSALVGGLSDEQLHGRSYASDWSIAQVASHLGSQAEIFGLFLDAGLAGQDAPGGDVFVPIWDRWNALPAHRQAADSVAANEAFVTRLEALPADQRAAYALSMFGTDLDLAGLASARLSEHALHTWDIAVALDPAATVPPDAVDLLVDTQSRTAQAGTPVPGGERLLVETTAPERAFLLTLDPEVTLTPLPTGAEPADTAADAVQLPAEAFIRLVAGRLDPDHTPPNSVDPARLDLLRTAFRGF